MAFLPSRLKIGDVNLAMAVPLRLGFVRPSHQRRERPRIGRRYIRYLRVGRYRLAAARRGQSGIESRLVATVRVPNARIVAPSAAASSDPMKTAIFAIEDSALWPKASS